MSALLPIYLRLGLSPVVLTVVANLANGVLNILPWGGPTIRAATVLNVSPGAVQPDGPGMVAGIATVLLLAWQLGRSERKRLLASGRTLSVVADEMVAVREPALVGGGTGTDGTHGAARPASGSAGAPPTPPTTSGAPSTRTARPCGRS